MAIRNPVVRLSKLSLFRGLSPEALHLVGDVAYERSFAANAVLFALNDLASELYVLLEGEVLETWFAGGAAIPKRQVEPGEVLGRWAAFNGQPHRTTAVVRSPSRLLSIPLPELHSLLARLPLLRQRLGRYTIACRLRGIPLFSFFADDQLFYAADLLDPVESAPGKEIYARGDRSDAFYVIDTGRVVERHGGRRGGRSPRRLTAGAFFGHEELLYSTNRQAAVVAETRTTLFQFSAAAFEWLRRLHPSFGRGLAGIDAAAQLAGVTLFSSLTRAELHDLAGYAGVGHLPRGEVLFSQDEADPTLYVLVEGLAKRRTMDEARTVRPLPPLRPGDVVGGPNLFVDEPWRVSVQAATRTVWLYLAREDLNQFLAQHPTARSKLVPPSSAQARSRDKSFAWLTADEEELLRRRRHILALVRGLFLWPGVIFWGAAVVLILLLWRADLAGLSALRYAGPALLLLWAAWCVLDYWNDFFVVTTKRVVYREKIIGLYESLSEVPLARVQNVVIRQQFFGNLFGYGRLNVDTAAASGIRPLSFTFLRRPEPVKSLVLEERERTMLGRLPQSRRLIREKIEDSTRAGLRAVVRLPAAPPGSLAQADLRPGVLLRAYRATLGHMFWLEQKKEDKVTWRKHPLRLLAKVWLPSVLAVVAGMAYALLHRDLAVSPWALIAALVPLAVWWWWRWADWSNDLYIVTRDRIIDTERLPLGLRSRRSEAPFDRVQNVTYELPNLVANVFDFGTVSIYTAGVEGKLDFEYVPHPRQVQAEIFRRISAFEEEQRRRQQERTDLGEWFGIYEQSH